MSSNDCFFDEYGRCIPKNNSHPVYEKSRRYFTIDQIEINYQDIYNRIKKFLNVNNKISINEFTNRAEKILDGLKQDPTTKNIVNGIGVPFFLPKNNHSNIGKDLIEYYLKALSQSFTDKNSDYDFVNHCVENLSNKVKINPNSRHEKIIELMKEQVVVGYYFPCILEYSFKAAIETINNFPKNFLLAGGFDTCAAFIGSPNLLLKKKGYPPLLWMTGLQGDNENVGYHMEAYGYNLTFNRRAHLGQAAEYWGHSLVVIE